MTAMMASIVTTRNTALCWLAAEPAAGRPPGPYNVWVVDQYDEESRPVTVSVDWELPASKQCCELRISGGSQTDILFN